MARRKTINGDDEKSNSRSSRSVAVAKKGVKTASDFANLMSALMTDVIDGSVSPQVANATVNAGGKLLKIVELQHRYGGATKSERKEAFRLI
jgi:hypothetical protein